MKKFNIIVAADQKNGIGKNNSLPWSLKGDMKYFKEITSNTILPLEANFGQAKNAVIMGRKTWDSIPEKFRPLPNRVNIVLSNNVNYSPHKDVVAATSLNGALDYCAGCPDIDQVFVIGGGVLYNEAFRHPLCDKIYLTRIQTVFGCDTFIPTVDKSFVLVSTSTQMENDVKYSFEVYNRINFNNQ
jgi:dihydrofolate reductase